MKLKIIGSGGCVSTPRPCCNCPICVEARKKGVPYARTGCSLYLENAGILIDTPEDIIYALNNAKVSEVKTILYSHCDPDHTMGMRVIEQLRMDWLSVSEGKKCENPITVTTLPAIMEGLKKQGTKYGSVLGYYVYQGLAVVKGARSLQAGEINISMVPVDETEQVTVFVIEEQDKKVIYAPCDVKPFPDAALFYDADVLIIGNTIVGDVLKDGFILKKDNPLRDELFTVEEVIALRNKYRIKEVIITHLEEDWGKSHDDYRELEKQYKNVRFAYDGLELCY